MPSPQRQWKTQHREMAVTLTSSRRLRELWLFCSESTFNNVTPDKIISYTCSGRRRGYLLAGIGYLKILYRNNFYPKNLKFFLFVCFENLKQFWPRACSDSLAKAWTLNVTKRLNVPRLPPSSLCPDFSTNRLQVSVCMWLGSNRRATAQALSAEVGLTCAKTLAYFVLFSSCASVISV